MDTRVRPIGQGVKQRGARNVALVDEADSQYTYERLLAANMVTSVRGVGLRIAPHVYNTAMDVLRVGQVLGDRTAA